MVRVAALHKSYPAQKAGLFAKTPERVSVLAGVDFEVRRGEVVGLLGANGAGKTTILQIVAGLTEPDSGTVTFEGDRRIGICGSADRSFYYRLTLRENLRFFGKLCGLAGAALSTRIDELLSSLDLTDYADRRYAQCSTGTRQRTALARALLNDPAILLLDEPTRAIDPLHAQRFRRLVRELAVESGKIVVLATNLLEEAWNTCDRIVLLEAGRGIAVDTPAALQRRMTRRARYRVDLDRVEAPLVRRLREVGAVEISAGDDPAVYVEIGPGPEPLRRLLFEVLQHSAGVRAISLDGPSPEQLFASEEIAR